MIGQPPGLPPLPPGWPIGGRPPVQIAPVTVAPQPPAAVQAHPTPPPPVPTPPTSAGSVPGTAPAAGVGRLAKWLVALLLLWWVLTTAYSYGGTAREVSIGLAVLISTSALLVLGGNAATHATQLFA